MENSNRGGRPSKPGTRSPIRFTNEQRATIRQAADVAGIRDFSDAAALFAAERANQIIQGDTMNATATTTVRESNSVEPLHNIFIEHDLDELTDEQQARLMDLTVEAIRPLVEAQWAERGITVSGWSSDPQNLRIEGIQGRGETDAEIDRYEFLTAQQISVWADAWAELNGDALWAQAKGA